MAGADTAVAAGSTSRHSWRFKWVRARRARQRRGGPGQADARTGWAALSRQTPSNEAWRRHGVTISQESQRPTCDECDSSCQSVSRRRDQGGPCSEIYGDDMGVQGLWEVS